MQMSFTGERYVPELRGQIYYEHFHRYALALGVSRDKDVLDIACGEGYGSAALALVARSVLGVDIDPESVRHAAARYTAMNLDFRTGDCTQIPAADASVDVVVSFETIEHLVGHEQMLSEISRILRPDGLLVISSPNKLVYSDDRGYENPFHVGELYFDEFRDMLRAFFPAVRLYGQRVFAGSAVHPLRGAAPDTRWLGPSVVSEGGMTALPDPEYFVAICCKSAVESLPDLCSVYLDPRDELLADIRSGGIATSRSNDVLMGRRDALPGGTVERAPMHLSPNAGLHHADVQTHASELEAQTAEFKAHAAELEAQVELLNAHLREAREAMAQLEESKSKQAQQLAEQLAELEQHFDKLTLAARDDVAAHRGELETLREELAAEKLHNASVQSELQTALEAALEASRRAERRTATLHLELESAQEGLREKASSAADDRRRIDARFEAMSLELLQRTAERDQLAVELAAATDTRRSAERRIAELQLKLSSIDELTQRAGAAETVLADVLSSTSWRMTLPARRFMGALRGGSKRP